MRLFLVNIIVLGLVIFSSCGNNNMDDKEVQVIDTVEQDLESKIKKVNDQLKNDPNNSALYIERAKLYLTQKLPEDAMQDADRALKLDSLNPDFLLFKSDLLLRKGNGLESKELIQKSIDNNPQHIPSLLKMTEMNLYLKDYVKAVENINAALKVDVYNAQAYFLKGLTYKLAGDTSRAVSNFQTAVEQNPDYYEAYMQLGLLYSTVNDPMAVSYYNNAIKLQPKSIEALYNKSLFLQENEKLDEAIEGYRLINSLDPNYQFAYYNIGYINLVYYEQYDSAIYYFNKALRINPSYFDAAYNIGYSYELKGQYDIAEQFYRKTLQQRPDHTLAANGLGRMLKH